MCTEAGLLALRERRMCVTQEDFKKAKEKVGAGAGAGGWVLPGAMQSKQLLHMCFRDQTGAGTPPETTALGPARRFCTRRRRACQRACTCRPLPRSF